MSYDEALKHCKAAHRRAEKREEVVSEESVYGSLDVNNPAHWARVMGRGTYDTSAGVEINPNTALRSTAVFACVRVLAFSLAQLPLIVYKRLERGKERAVKHPAYNLLHVQPNNEISSFHWRSLKMAHVLLYGNAYSEIEFNGRGDPVAFWPIPAWRCRPVRVNTKSQNNLLVYEVLRPDKGQEFILPSHILHIKGLSTDGLSGLSVIGQAAQAIGVSLAAQDLAARFFGQGFNIGGVVEHPNALSDTAYKRLKDDLTEKYEGLSKAHRLLFLEEGMKFSKMGIPPEEAQFLESRQFEVVDIARMFGVPPHKIGDLSRATFSNIEHQAIEFVQDTMMPWFVNWEQEINRKLMDSAHFAEFLAEGLLRGDSAARGAFYKDLFNMGSLSPNDVREKENMNPVPGGDKRFVPLNMVPIEESGGERGKSPSEERKAPTLEERKRMPMTRYKVAKSYQSVFEAAGERIVAREVKNLRKEIKKQLGERSVTQFKDYLTDFYRDFQEFIARQIKPAVASLSDAIVPLAQEEVGDTDVDTSAFVNEYADTFAYRYAESSQGQLESLLEKDDAEAAIEQRLAEWEQKRAKKVGMNETVQLSNAIAKLVFVSAGVTAMVWYNTSSNPCPYCEEMNGRKVGIKQNFLGFGTKLEAESGGGMNVYRPCSQPPLHEGCQCQVGAG